MKTNHITTAPITLSLAALVFLVPSRAFAHCDTMDGPVVKTARKALAERDVNLVLPWVHKPAEPEIKQAFERALAVRELGGKAKELADQYFFETLVRVHRAGEGAPFTGLKPAGAPVEPVVEQADKALENGSVDKLVKQVTDEAAAGLRRRFLEARNKQAHAGHNVEAGREFVAAYVEYVHYAQGLQEAAKGAGAHDAENQQTPRAEEAHQAALSKHNH